MMVNKECKPPSSCNPLTKEKLTEIQETKTFNLPLWKYSYKLMAIPNARVFITQTEVRVPQICLTHERINYSLYSKLGQCILPNLFTYYKIKTHGLEKFDSRHLLDFYICINRHLLAACGKKY